MKKSWKEKSDDSKYWLSARETPKTPLINDAPPIDNKREN